MNDLTFGASLLSLFAAMLIAAFVSDGGAPARAAAAQSARPAPIHVAHAPAPAVDCATVALAPGDIR